MKSIFIILITLFSLSSLNAQDYALAQIENSPRHHEWVKLESSGRTMYNFVAYPERSDKAPIVIVIHENRGLNEWARSFADQLAAEGFIAIAPDLISNTVDGFEKTTDFANSDDARSAIYELDPDKVTADLLAVHDYAKSLDSWNGQIVVAGFCWGGSQSFRFATNAGNMIDAAMVFYGTGPSDATAYAEIDAPVYGFYGGADNRVNSTIEASEAAMKEYGKTYEYEIYEGAGHAYMRRGDDPSIASDDPNKLARDKSWERILMIMKNL